ncbi:hypothetical protein TREVI0001_1557 [Treponema vincentii ATCC 35580]|uniref:Uncharacterized protein n=1 Tax=Treponema vincentii ATCC 35580 TaxID=596324 RepID=C8PN53_9SPIR|nr:hypothetical protein TREVI0001_1557 [Treponema vincentii ATCC 35580]
MYQFTHFFSILKLSVCYQCNSHRLFLKGKVEQPICRLTCIAAKAMSG